MCRPRVVLLSLLPSSIVIVFLLNHGAARGLHEPLFEGAWRVPHDRRVPREEPKEASERSTQNRVSLQNTTFPGTDRYGDALPTGALARLGTARFRHEIITTVVWSSDGKLLASAGWDSPLRLWDAATGKQIRRFAGHKRDKVLAWSPDGKTLASAWDDEDSTIYLSDVATGKEIRRLDGRHDDGVHALAWSADGRWLASGGDDNLIRLWSAATGKLRRRIGRGNGPNMFQRVTGSLARR